MLVVSLSSFTTHFSKRLSNTIPCFGWHAKNHFDNRRKIRVRDKQKNERGKMSPDFNQTCKIYKMRSTLEPASNRTPPGAGAGISQLQLSGDSKQCVP